MDRKLSRQRLAAIINRHEIFRLHLLVGQGAGGYQQPPLNPQRQISGRALIQAGAVHGTGHIDELAAQGPLVHLSV